MSTTDSLQPHHSDKLSYFRTGDGCRIAYKLEGEEGKPVLVLSNSICVNLSMWDDQVSSLIEHFQVLRYDTRGHGASDVPVGSYSIERMGRDVLEMLEHLNIKHVHFCGLSLGGFIGQWLGVHAPDKIDRLILVNTSSYLGPADQWDKLIQSLVESKDMLRMAEMFLGNWFPERMLNENKAVVAKFREMILSTDPNGLAGAFAAVRDCDLRRPIVLIQKPTLVIAGKHDQVTLPEHSELISRSIPGSELVILPSVHMTNVESPQEFIGLVLPFLQAPPGSMEN